MKRILNNQSGITLIEILAASVLMGIFSILIFNVFNNSSMQYDNQRQKSYQLNDASFVLKIITKEIRMNNANNIKKIDYGIRIVDSNVNYQLDPSTHNIYKFKGEPNTFNKNHEIIASNIDTFILENIPANNENKVAWHILIKVKNKNIKQIETTIYSRS